MLVEPHAKNLGFAQRDVDVLWVNNLRQFKRPDLAVELARRLPELNFHMIGGPQPGEDALYEGIRSQAGSIGNLTFHGRVPYHDVNDFYERARVFVNTSDSEGFPNSYLQAWRRGTPSVAFFDPDSVIARHGLGHAAVGMDAMVEQVRRLASDERHWQENSRRCQHFMDEYYGDDRVLRPYLELVESPA